MPNKPELLSPAGDPERLQMAVRYGADAVYLAGKSYGMRAKCGNFSDQELAEAVKFCHENGVKVYVTANVLARTGEIRQMPPFFELCQDIGVDAFILGDLGVFKAAERYAPKVERHISTQMGVVSADTARAWYDLGATRVVLARELSAAEIRAIRAGSTIELEAFAHGALCMSVSGQCYFSAMLGGRSGNRGRCAQTCRLPFAAPGGTPVYAIADGIVSAAAAVYSYGNCVQISHGTADDGNTYDSLYAHLSSIAVSQGSAVTKGQVIGYVGNTGNVYSTGGGGYHLHLELRVNRARVNPLAYVPQ